MRAARTPLPRPPISADLEEATAELSDVPAAVVCANCGSPECGGSCGLDRSSNVSGVLAIVPWERPGGTLLTRLWATAKLGALSPETFFSSLPAGGVLAPLGFAVLSELLAAAGLCLTLIGFALVVVPSLGKALLLDTTLLRLVLPKLL